MFTGLVQALGSIKSLGKDRFALTTVRKESLLIFSDLAIGDSVAVDGVCLTVEEILIDGFVATASPETLQRTTLGKQLKTAEYVNLETSLRVGSKLGGHFVTGHIDGIGCLIESVSTEKSWEMIFGAPPGMSEQWSAIARYLVTKGSVAVNGISLTISDCDADGSWFKAAVIPHTYAQTNLCYLKIGDLVNIESDILGKYVDRLIAKNSLHPTVDRDISIAFLAENGYL